MTPDTRPRGAPERLDGLLSAFVELPAPDTEELRDAVRALGVDPDEVVSRVRELVAAKEEQARPLVQLSQRAVQAHPKNRRGARIRQWFDHRFVKLGTCAGGLGGVCCLGKAVTVSAGLGLSSFFGMMVDNYQLYFVVGSLGLLAIWLFRMIRAQGVTVTGLRAAIRSSAPHAVVSFGTYVLTLGFTMAVMALADWLWPRS
ncbi:MAG: hypothetical protein HY726_22580 [Candidatus Rokubacteria bacterium]|nr:hypothetical protein [Candidatus Rokubacteria bacterium]